MQQYEKSGAGDFVPFRLNNWAGLAADWPTAVFTFDWRRRVAAAPLAGEAFGLQQQASEFPLLAELKPEVADKFSMTAEYNASTAPKKVTSNTFCWMVSLPPFRTDSATGRAELPEEAFDPNALAIEVPQAIYRTWSKVP
jgi:hypothetical protein